MTRFILIDGKDAATVDALDRGLQFGDGLFETLAVIDGRVRILSSHLARLEAGCERLAIQTVPMHQLRSELETAAKRLGHGVLKVIVTRGSGGRGYRLPENPVSRRILIASDWPVLPDRLRLIVCQTRLATDGSLAGIKHLNRLEQVMACAEWQQDENADEGLMLDRQGHVIETTSANVFLVRDNRVITPALERCGVAGVMRQQVIDLIEGSGGDCESAEIMLEDVRAADELFLTNSLTAIRPVVALEDQVWNPGPVTATLSRRLAARLQQDRS